MANTKSAIKRTRKIKRQTAVNRSRKSRFKNALKKMNSLNALSVEIIFQETFR